MGGGKGGWASQSQALPASRPQTVVLKSYGQHKNDNQAYSKKFLRGFFWKKYGPHAKSNSSQRAVSLYGVCIAHIHESVISAPITGALQNIH